MRAPLRLSPSPMPWHNARQLVVVTTADWNVDHGTLRRFERDGGTWHAVGEPQPVLIGRSGSAWGIGLHPPPSDGPVKREGDGRSPAGVFAIGEAFGYAPTARTALPYSAMAVVQLLRGCQWLAAVQPHRRYARGRRAGRRGRDGTDASRPARKRRPALSPWLRHRAQPAWRADVGKLHFCASVEIACRCHERLHRDGGRRRWMPCWRGFGPMPIRSSSCCRLPSIARLAIAGACPTIATP